MSGEIKKDDPETLSPRNHNVSVLFATKIHRKSTKKKKKISIIQNEEDLQKYLLASSEVGELLQEEWDLQVRDGRPKNAGVRNQLDFFYKSVLRQQNPYEVVFNDTSKFDGINWITGNLFTEIKSEKLTDEAVQKFLSGTPNPKN